MLEFKVQVSHHDLCFPEVEEVIIPKKGEEPFKLLLLPKYSRFNINGWGYVTNTGVFVDSELQKFKYQLQNHLQAIWKEFMMPAEAKRWINYLKANKTHFKILISELSFDNKNSAHYMNPSDDLVQGISLGGDEANDNFKKIGGRYMNEVSQGVNSVINEIIENFLKSPEVSGALRDQRKERLIFSFNLNNDEKLNDLWDYIKNNDLIGENTAKRDFKSIMGISKPLKAVNWMASLSLLHVLVKNLPASFLPGNDFNHFVAASHCFTHRGREISPDQIRNNKPAKGHKESQRLVQFLKDLT